MTTQATSWCDARVAIPSDYERRRERLSAEFIGRLKVAMRLAGQAMGLDDEVGQNQLDRLIGWGEKRTNKLINLHRGPPDVADIALLAEALTVRACWLAFNEGPPVAPAAHDRALTLALEYLGDSISPKVAIELRSWAAQHPQRFSPRRWGEIAERAQAQLVATEGFDLDAIVKAR